MRARCTAPLVLVGLVAGLSGARCAEPALLLRGRVLTLDPARPRAEALALSAGRVLAIGSLGEVRAAVAGRAVREVDHGSAAIVPGLGDAHGHLASLGRKLASLDLTGVRSETELVIAVARAARRLRPGQWLYGRGWDQTRWPGGEFPTHHALSAAVSVPVVLRRVDGHASLVNAAALRAAGLDARTPEPPGGRILRDGRGEPTGVLVDAAMELVRPPPLTQPERLAHLRAAVAHLATLGFTQVHDLGTEPETLALLRGMEAQRELPLRVVAYLWAGDGQELARVLAGAPDPEPGPGWRVLVRGVKLIADGAMGSRGAALLAPYADEPGQRGHLLWEPEALRAAIARIDGRGFQPAVHAIGDLAVRTVLEAYAALPPRALPPRVEHLQLLPVEGEALLRAVVRRAGGSGAEGLAEGGGTRAPGLVASMQPTHLASDQRWVVGRIGGARAARAYDWRAARDAGARLAFGSDFPVEDPEPLHGLHAARTRGDRSGAPAPFGAAAGLSGTEALEAFTTGVAAAAGLRGHGPLAPGAVADLSVFDVDLVSAAPPALLRARALGTYLDGRPVPALRRGP